MFLHLMQTKLLLLYGLTAMVTGQLIESNGKSTPLLLRSTTVGTHVNIMSIDEDPVDGKQIIGMDIWDSALGKTCYYGIKEGTYTNTLDKIDGSKWFGFIKENEPEN